MEEENTQRHSKETFIYLLSSLLERAGYYGIRTLIVVYMISEVINVDRSDALSTYAWFTSLILITQIAGAILGDLAIGNKKAIVFGGVIQAIGAFCLCIPNIEGLYLGLILIVIGGGLFFPNIIANFGKLYFDKKRQLDSAYGMNYLAVSIGAFIGVFTISYLGEKYGVNVGFIIAGVLMLLSIVPMMVVDEDRKMFPENVEVTLDRRILNIVISVLLVAVFWAAYEMSGVRFTIIGFNLSEVSTLDFPKIMWTNYQSVALFPILALLIFLWTYFYSSYQFKLLLGFLFGAVSYGVLLFIPEVPGDQHVLLYFTSLLFLVLAEAHIGPIINAVVAKYAAPKYLAIVFSLIFIPSRVGAIMLGVYNELIFDNQIGALVLGMITMLLISVGIAVYLLIKKNRPSAYRKA